jgi:hypothetical protein
MNLQWMQTSSKVRWRALVVAGGAVLTVFVTHAFALGLGEAHVASVLGQPLQMTVPLVMDRGTQLTQECVRIIPGSESGETTPSLNTGRISIDAANRQLRIESLYSISEPTLKVAVEVGCNERIRREFALLLDPPVVAPGISSGVAGSVQPVSSLGLGMAQISAVVGQRLTLKVPVVGPGADSLTAGCVHLADPIVSEGAPALRQADIRVVPQDGGSLIEVATPEAVTESAVRLALDVGCQDPLRREYAILLGMPALAASHVDTTAAAAEPTPAEAAPKPAAKPVTRARNAALAAPAATESRQTRPAPAQPLEPSTKVAQAAAPSSDRLVLGSAEEDAGSGARGSDLPLSAFDQNAELAKRLDAMSKQIEALQAQLLASQQHEQELERRAAEVRDEWTWSMAGLAALLLVGALLIAWRQHRLMPESAWEPVVSRAPQPVAPGPAAPRVAGNPAANPAVNHFERESSEIAGRATMPGRMTSPAPISAAITEPSLLDEQNSQITVTELHDTVQVIKELYATVLERNTANNGASSRAKPSRPLELDLRTPDPMDAPGGSSHLLAEPVGSEPSDKRASEVRFTELPTEVGLDLDLSSVVAAAPEVMLTDLLARAERAASPIHQPAVAAAAATQATVQTAASASTFVDPALPVVGADRPGAAGHGPLSDDNLTQTPTEVLIDLDVGTATGFSHTNRPTLEPIDLQLDLSQPQVRFGPRAGRIA